MFDAFLSYARADEADFREALVPDLLRNELRIWFDRESLPSRGTTFDQEIRRAIESSARLLLVVGPEALKSEYVEQEWGFADDLGVPVIPVVRHGDFDDLPQRLRSYHAVDARPPQTVDAVVTELVRLLSEPVVPLGVCHGFPTPPAHEHSRPDLLERLWVALGLDRQRPADAGRAPRTAALYGVSGVGKSTVAAAFARSTRSRRSFSDGIAWLSCGPSFQTLAGARAVLRQVAVGAQLPGSVEEVPDALAAGLSEREILVVLDDVRDAASAAPFVSALGPGGRALVTTLDQTVATALGAVDIAVEQLDDASARQLLEGWTDGPLPPEADDVLAATDGLPFALAIVGAMIRDRVSWALVVEALEAGRLDLLENRFPGYPHPTLLRALSASYDALAASDPRSAQCYLELAAFRPRAELTESVIVRLWSRPGRLSPLEAGLVLAVLERRLLLIRRPAAEGDRFVLHGLHEDFVRLESTNRPELEAALVDSYRTEKGDAEWSALSDDGYVYDHLIAHLAALGERTELTSAVNGAWVRRQLLRRGDLGQALDDVRLALDAAAEPPLDIPTIAGLSVVAGQVAAALREAPALLVGAMAEIGDIDQALRWAADTSDAAQRFDALVAVAQALINRGEVALARRVVRTAATTIPLLGGVVETGMFSGLTAMNAVHALVDFPGSDEWEGTTDEFVALARIPLDAVVRLAKPANEVGAIHELTTVAHPFWELYGHLIPLVAVEELADQGEPALAAALLDELDEAFEFGDDRADAERYRRAVATASVGRFDEARAAVEALPDSYLPVAYRGLARHLAAAGRAEDALTSIELIRDDTVADQAIEDVIRATIARGEPDACRKVAQFVDAREWGIAEAWLLAAGGDPTLGLEMLERSPRDDFSLGLGVELGHILLEHDRPDEATDVARRLVPAAERLLGPQWFAPETTDAAPNVGPLGGRLLSLLARTGEPLPEALVPLALIVETRFGSMANFKFQVILDLVIAGRFREAHELAGTGAGPHERALGLATALSVAAASEDPDELRDAAAELGRALDGAGSGGSLDAALGAATRALIAADLTDAAAGLVERLPARPGLWSAIGVWASARARAEQSDEVRGIVRSLLVERPLQVPDAWARALMLSTVAARRSEPGDELDAAVALLADLGVAARTLDVVLEAVDLYARHHGLEAASSLARGMAEGPAAALVEESLAGGSIEWEGDLSEDELAAAAAVRAVASAGVVLAARRSGDEGEAERWLRRTETLALQAERLAPHLDVATAIGKYVDAAGAAVADTQPADDEKVVHATAWLLWEKGLTKEAVRYAQRALDEVGDPFESGPQIRTVAELERSFGDVGAAKASLRTIVALGAAVAGDTARAKDLATAALPETGGYGWLALTPAERAETRAFVAIALARAEEGDAAREQLGEAIESAITLAQRGEMTPFPRLCQALLEVLPAAQATSIWATWLTAAAGTGANETLILIASFVRWLPDADLASLAVDAESGRLHSRP